MPETVSVAGTSPHITSAIFFPHTSCQWHHLQPHYCWLFLQRCSVGWRVGHFPFIWALSSERSALDVRVNGEKCSHTRYKIKLKLLSLLLDRMSFFFQLQWSLLFSLGLNQTWTKYTHRPHIWYQSKVAASKMKYVMPISFCFIYLFF